jgi:hypothetical protein
MQTQLTEQARARLRILQVVVIALAIGVAVFAGVGLAVASQTAGSGRAAPLAILLRVISLGLLAVGVSGAFLFRHLARSRIAGASLEPSTREGVAMSHTFTSTLIGASMLEGPALLAVVNLIMHADPVDAGIAAAGVALLLILCFPLEGRVLDLVARAGDPLDNRP